MGIRAAAALAAVLAGGIAFQDPEPAGEPGRPRAPEDADPLPPVREPFRTPVERDDLIQRFDPASPIQGVYRLQSMVRGNGVVPSARGYLIATRRYLSVHLRAPGTAPDLPLLRAGFRRYRIVGEELEMESLLGHFNDRDGDVALLEPGTGITRRFSVTGGILRLHTGEGGYLDFVRVE